MATKRAPYPLGHRVRPMANQNRKDSLHDCVLRRLFLLLAHGRAATSIVVSNALCLWFATTPATKCVFQFLLSCLFAWHRAMFSCLFARQPCRLFFFVSVLFCFPASSAALPGTVPSVLFCVLAYLLGIVPPLLSCVCSLTFSCLYSCFAWHRAVYFLASVLLCFPAYAAALLVTVPSKAATVSPLLPHHRKCSLLHVLLSRFLGFEDCSCQETTSSSG